MFPFSLSWIMMSGLLLGMVLSACTCWFHNGLPYLQDLFVLILVYAYASLHCSFDNIGHAETCSAVSSSWHNLCLLSVSISNIFVACYFVCNAWSCAAIISLCFSFQISPRQP
jgi:hypothetical protein